MKFETSIERRMSGRHKKALNIINYQNKKILDIGCSYGWFEKEVDAKITAIDLCKKDLKIAKEQVRKKEIIFEEGSALNLKKYKKNYFDCVVMFDVLEHLPKDSEEKALSGIFRVLKKRGILIISTPAKNFTKFLDPAWYFGHRHYKTADLIKLLEKNSFKPRKVEIKGGLYELISMILFYPSKWILNSEIPFKKWFDSKREEEYLIQKGGRVTLFITAEKDEK